MSDNDTALAELRHMLRGRLIEPHEEGYEQARRVYNGMIDKRPRAIARCADVADVIEGVRTAREHDLLLALRGGGHNGAGLGTCDDGLVLDLAALRGIRVDPHSRTVRVGAGCTQGDMDHATHAFGLAVPAGVVSTTGVAGLTLGGGHGYLARKYGLTIDSLLEADVVLADGRMVVASPRQHEDLFWALRGGGGNFGAVTSFLYRAHPVDTVLAGPMMWDLADCREIAQWYRDFMPRASEDLYGFLAVQTVPPGPPFPEHLHGKKTCGIIWCYSGRLQDAERALAPVRRLRPPVFEGLGPIPFTALQGMFDPLFPPGLQWYWKGDFFRELSDELISEFARFAAELPTPLSTAHFYPIDGAVNRVGPHETAFAYRDVRWSMVIAGIDTDPANAERITQWARNFWKALHPHSAGGAYVNFMMDEGGDRIRATFRDNYPRLAEAKMRYDPTNLFRVNQNIVPAPSLELAGAAAE
jgi:FAD/FMN-containing dehydrogenase